MASCTKTDCGFPCNQTPLQINRTSDISNLSGVETERTRGYGNATARLVSLTPGSLVVSKTTDGSSGIFIEEQIQNTFTLYGVPYTLDHLRLFVGQHKVFPWVDVSGQCGSLQKDGDYTTAPLEMYCYFKNSTTRRTLCLVLPIGIAAGADTNASTYFRALNQPPTSSTPTLSTLFKDLSLITKTSSNAKNPILHYFGQDIRTYITTVNNGAVQQSTCDSSSLRYPIEYLLIMNDINGTKKFSTTITPDDVIELIKLLTNLGIVNYLNLNKQTNGTNIGIKSGDMYKLRLFEEGTLYISNSANGKLTYDTNALKCYPVDPQKNIKDGELYLDETGQPTNINCPSKDFRIFGNNNGKYYCCDDGNKTDTNKCGNTDSSHFCGLNTNKDPFDNTISTCDETKRELLNLKSPPSNFLTSVAGIETIIALGVGIIFGGVFLIFTRYRTFTDKSAAATAATAAATGATVAADIIVTSAVANALKTAKTNVPYPGWWWAVITLLILLGGALTAVILISLYTIRSSFT